MKKSVTFAFLFSVLIFSACKNKTTTSTDQESSQPSSSSPSDQKPAAANEPESFQAVFTPDSAILGKQNEALVKIISGKAISLQDPDGKSNGTEVTINLNVTNKHGIGSSRVYLSFSDSRMQLDNGTNITGANGSELTAEPEATSETKTWTYTIPSGAKPVALNLFYDQTRVSVKMALK